MPLAALLNLAAFILLVVVPGLLLHRLLLMRLNLSWRVSIALILAAQSVLFSNIASIFGYSLGLMLAISFLTIAALLMMAAVVLTVPLLITYLETGLVPRFPTAILATGLVIVAVLSFFAGLILDTVTRGRREMRRLAYLAQPAVSNGT